MASLLIVLERQTNLIRLAMENDNLSELQAESIREAALEANSNCELKVYDLEEIHRRLEEGSDEEERITTLTRQRNEPCCIIF